MMQKLRVKEACFLSPALAVTAKDLQRPVQSPQCMSRLPQLKEEQPLITSLAGPKYSSFGVHLPHGSISWHGIYPGFQGAPISLLSIDIWTPLGLNQETNPALCYLPHRVAMSGISEWKILVLVSKYSRSLQNPIPPKTVQRSLGSGVGFPIRPI